MFEFIGKKMDISTNFLVIFFCQSNAICPVSYNLTTIHQPYCLFNASRQPPPTSHQWTSQPTPTVTAHHRPLALALEYKPHPQPHLDHMELELTHGNQVSKNHI